MTMVLGAMLIVRLGIRGGEAELDQYWRLFENLADPSFIADARGNIRLSNPAYAALLSSLAPAGTDKPSLPDVFDGIPLDRLAQPLGKDQTFDATLRADGTPYLVTLSPIVGENRRLLIAGVAHNLREQKQQSDAIQSAYDELRVVHGRLEDLNARLEQRVEERTQTLQVAYDQLEEQNRVLQSLDQIKTDFVSMVSHELRAPLTNLGGGVELLLRHTHNSTDTGILRSIQEEIKRLTRFVETILNVSAMEAGKLVLHPMALSLPVVAHAARDGWSNTPDLQRIEIDMDEDLPLVIGDEEALRSVIGHLLDNALKYAPEGPVRIAALHQGDRVLVEVRDFGPGVPIDKRSLLFQRFQRMDSKDSQVVYGYGLGLYMSQRLLRSMGGTLEFEAPADGGARFSFYLETAK
jgi:signal transduction histidine kinase